MQKPKYFLFNFVNSTAIVDIKPDSTTKKIEIFRLFSVFARLTIANIFVEFRPNHNFGENLTQSRFRLWFLEDFRAAEIYFISNVPKCMNVR